MTELEEYNFRYLIEDFKNICVNIDMFTDMCLKRGAPLFSLFDPATSRELLLAGNFGSMFKCKIWVNKSIPVDCIKISNQLIHDVKEDKWSLPVPLRLVDINNFDRILNLKAFW